MNKLDSILCINLPTSQERRQNITQEFQKHQILAKVIWVSALTPQDINLKQIKHDRLLGRRCYCQDQCKHRYRKLRPVEIAIALSHKLAYQKLVDLDMDLALICEDDIVLHSEFNTVLDRLLSPDVINQLMSEQPYLIFLGGRSDNPSLKKNTQQLKISQNGSYSNYGYLINYAGAQALLKHFFPIQRPEDSYKRFLIGRGTIKCYQVSPSLIGELSAGVNQPRQYSRLSRS